MVGRNISVSYQGAVALNRRRRMYLMRRRAVVGATAVAGVRRPEGSTAANRVPEGSTAAIVGNPPPVVGATAVTGVRRQKEDSVSIKSGLCAPAINGYLPVHYIGVFAGYGGNHFSMICEEKMHEILKEELMADPFIRLSQRESEVGSTLDTRLLLERWRRVMSRCFWNTEKAGFQRCNCSSGTTAVVVVLTENHIVTANCGNSRAVLYRSRGITVPLSFDHTADTRPDEVARIEASWGWIPLSYTRRIIPAGVSNVTRVIGDAHSKPFMVSEPEVTINRRCAEDEFIILASSGLWDVIPNKMAGDVTRECLKEARGVMVSEEECVFSSRSAAAATLLCRLAQARKSGDNICVVVVDLKRAQNGSGGPVTVEI